MFEGGDRKWWCMRTHGSFRAVSAWVKSLAPRLEILFLVLGRKYFYARLACSTMPWTYFKLLFPHSQSKVEFIRLSAGALQKQQAHF